jgi:hypothetical protein
VKGAKTVDWTESTTVGSMAVAMVVTLADSLDNTTVYRKAAWMA